MQRVVRRRPGSSRPSGGSCSRGSCPSSRAGVPEALDRIDRVEAGVVGDVVADVVEDEELRLWTDVGGVADAGDLEVRLGALGDAARIAVVALAGDRIVDVADDVHGRDRRCRDRSGRWSGSGIISMSDSLIAWKPRIEEPSKPTPCSKISSSTSEIDFEVCCQVPSRSQKRKSTIFTPFSLAIFMTSAGVVIWSGPAFHHKTHTVLEAVCNAAPTEGLVPRSSLTRCSYVGGLRRVRFQSR